MMKMDEQAIKDYVDLIEQGFSPAQANAHVQINYGVRLTRTMQVLAERRAIPGVSW